MVTSSRCPGQAEMCCRGTPNTGLAVRGGSMKRTPSIQRVRKVFRKYRGNVARVAKNIGYTTCGTYRLLKRLGLR